MGWSCSQAAGITMDRLNALGATFYFQDIGVCFIEWSNEENDAGDIFGEIMLMLPEDKCRKFAEILISGVSGQVTAVDYINFAFPTYRTGKALKDYLQRV